ncbi:MAG: class I SAM-dependent methyltransferase [Nocardioidaceae bacterium]
MSVAYQVMYRLGFTPWDHKSPEALAQIAELLDREEQLRSQPFGRAIDIGCGMGTQTIDLARRGWDVVGVDMVDKALATARDRAAAAGVDLRLVHVSATRLSEALEGGFSFAVDLGCFHGLTDDERLSYGRELTAVTQPDATLLMFCFTALRRGWSPLPRGATRQAVETALPDWHVDHEDAAATAGMPDRVAGAQPRWFRLSRN